MATWLTSVSGPLHAVFVGNHTRGRDRLATLTVGEEATWTVYRLTPTGENVPANYQERRTAPVHTYRFKNESLSITIRLRGTGNEAMTRLAQIAIEYGIDPYEIMDMEASVTGVGVK